MTLSHTHNSTSCTHPPPHFCLRYFNFIFVVHAAGKLKPSGDSNNPGKRESKPKATVGPTDPHLCQKKKCDSEDAINLSYFPLKPTLIHFPEFLCKKNTYVFAGTVFR